MANGRPFVGLRYDERIAGPLDGLTTPPYDAISGAERDRYERLSPRNVVHLILGHVEPGDGERVNRYTRAADALRAWREEGALVPHPEPAVFPYEMRFHFGGRERHLRGMILEVEIEPWGGSILPHERTLPGPLEDRLHLLRTVRTNLSPVYAMLRGPSLQLEDFLGAATDEPPIATVVDEAGTQHRLWATPHGAAAATEALAASPLLIADGHHRYSVALAYRGEMRARFGPGPWDWMMMFVVDAATEDPPVLPFHRAILTPELGSPREALHGGERVRDLAEVLASVDDDAVTVGIVQVEQGELAHRIVRLDGAPPAVLALHTQVLVSTGGAGLRFLPDAVAAEELVRIGEATTAFILPPTHVDRIRRIVEHGGRLPEKSTYFWPKPRTGLVMRTLEDQGVMPTA